MALVVADRVQETTTTSGTGTLSLGGAVAGYRSFVSGIGSGNTTYYTIYDQTAQVWEVGIGTVTSGSPNTLSRDTVYANSSGTTAKINLAGNSASVFCVYTASKSVNLDASGNVTPLGTIASGVWQGTTVGVAYGGTGVTASSGANSVVLRDSNQNITVNRLNQSSTAVTAAGTITTLTAASTFSQILNGTGGQTFKLPDATTLTNTTTFEFNNNATGTLTITDNAGATVGTISSGGAAAIALLSNGTVGGTWDVHAYIPENVTWGTNSLVLGSTVITGGTWNGGTITSAYGGTGLTTFSAANNALYSTSASALAAGTLPVAAGGTGITSLTLNRIPYGNGTSAFQSSANLTFDGTTLTANSLTVTNNPTLSGGTANGVLYLNGSKVATSGSALTFDGTNLGVGTATAGNAGTVNVSIGAPGTTAGGLQLWTSTTSSSYLQWGTAASGTSYYRGYLQYNYNAGSDYLAFGIAASEGMRLTSTGLGIGTSSPAFPLAVNGLVHTQGSNAGISICRRDTGAQSWIWYSASGSLQAYDVSTSLTRMTLDTSGNLGLGVTPSAWNNTYKAMQIGYGGSLYGRTASSAVAVTSNAFVNSGGSFQYINTEAASVYIQGSGQHTWYNAPSGTAGTAITLTQAMTLGSNSVLSLDNYTASGKGRLAFGNSGVGYVESYDSGNAGSGAYMGFGVGGTERARIDSSGNLGIGTSSPAYKLDVSGTLHATGNVNFDGSSVNLTTNAAQLTTTYAGVTTSRFYTNASGLNLSVDGSWPLIFTNSSTERARIDSSGNFNVGGTLALGKVYSQTSAAGYAYYAYGNFTNGAEGGIYTGASYLGLNCVSHALTFASNNIERARIDTSGNLLFGTTTSPTGSSKVVFRQGGTSNPDSTWNSSSWPFAVVAPEPALYLSSNIVAATGVGGATQTAKGGIGFRYVSSANPTELDIGIIGTSTVPGPVCFYNDTERARIDSSGNMGIGGTGDLVGLAIQTPSYTTAYAADLGANAATAGYGSQLQVVSPSDTSTVSGISLFTRSTGRSRWDILNVWTGTYLGDLVFRRRNGGTSTAEAARITNAGGFSVGTTADPGAGAIYATGNITAYYSSDRKFKENIREIPNALEKVNAIGGKLFDWTDEYIESKGGADGYFVQKEDFGVVAQDVQKVFPVAVRTRPDGSLAVDYEKLGALAFAALVELTKRVEALENKEK